MRWLSLSLLLMVSCVLPLAARAEVAVPPLRSPLTDLTGTLTREQSGALERKLRAFEERKGTQLAVLMLPSTAPEDIAQYSIRVAEAWKVGRKRTDDGVIVVMAKEDRAVRIEVGYGLEGALPDVLAHRITDQVMVPFFREGRYADGIDAGVDRIIAVLDGEILPEPERRAAPAQRGPQGISQSLPFLLMLVFVGSGIARRVFGSLFGATLMGGIAAAVTWVITSTVLLGVGAGFIAFLFTLLGGGLGGGGGGGWRSGRGGGWGGGFGGGGGFGRGGGGGWSGGGGSFGGGGATGRW